LTESEDFSEAALVVESLGDPDRPSRIVANRSQARPSGMVTIADLEAIVAASRHALARDQREGTR
jgi:hypothetical protein